MGQFESSANSRHLWSQARTPAASWPAAPAPTHEAVLRLPVHDRRGRSPDQMPLDLLDTAPQPAVSGALALLTDPAVDPAPLRHASRRSILIVEDDARTAGVLRSALELEGEIGWEIEVAGEGTRALELAACTPPDLVLLDVRLPGMDGAEVYRRLRATPRGRRLRVLFLSAGTSLDLYQRGIEDGVLLRKPFDVQDLIGLVRALLEE
jgi:CheY-like chemotaxis protein